MGNVFRSVLAVASAILQSKTVAAGTSNVTISPDQGYDGLSSVTIQPTPSQTKSVTPTRSAQTVNPDAGRLLSSVSVGGIPSQYIIPTGNVNITNNGSGIDVSSYETASVNVPSPMVYSVTPSDSIPPDLERNKIYQPTSAGYAIESYSNVAPSASGTYFSSGMKKMSSSGYAYSSQPSADMDFFATLYNTSGQQTYTFSQNLKVAYVCVPTNNTSNRGTYTGSGSMTSAYTGTYQVINKITNVKSGDTFKAPSFAVSSVNRTLMWIVGQKA